MKSSQTGRKLQGKDILIEGGSYRDSLMMMDGEEEITFFEWVIAGGGCDKNRWQFDIFRTNTDNHGNVIKKS